MSNSNNSALDTQAPLVRGAPGFAYATTSTFTPLSSSFGADYKRRYPSTAILTTQGKHLSIHFPQGIPRTYRDQHSPVPAALQAISQQLPANQCVTVHESLCSEGGHMSTNMYILTRDRSEHISCTGMLLSRLDESFSMYQHAFVDEG